MGLDIFDALSAIGAGGAVIGKQKLDEKAENRKLAFAKQLADEEAARVDKRDERRAQRERDEKAGTVAKTDIVQGDGGNYFEVRTNAYGDEIGRAPADPLKIEGINNARLKDKYSIDQVLASTEASRASTDATRQRMQYEPQKFSLDQRLTESQIAENEAQAARAKRDDPKTTVDDSLGGLTNELIKQTADLQTEYTKGDAPVMTATEYRLVAQAAVREAARNGKDATIVMNDALQNYIARKNKRK